MVHPFHLVARELTKKSLMDNHEGLDKYKVK